MNGSFYAAIERIPLGTAVTVEFLGPLTLAAVLSRRLRELTWVLLAAAGVALLGLGDGSGPGLDPAGVGLALVAGLFWACYILASRRVGAPRAGARRAGARDRGRGAGCCCRSARSAPRMRSSGRTRCCSPPAPACSRPSCRTRWSWRRCAGCRAHVFGVLLSLEPAIAALAGWVLLSQPLGPVGAVAVGVVVLASAGSTLAARRVDRDRELTAARASDRRRPPPAAACRPSRGSRSAAARATLPLGAAT